MTNFRTLMTVTAAAASLTLGCGENTLELLSSEEDALLLESTQDLSAAEAAAVYRGAKVFLSEKFGGNDRTCVTCHTLGTGTLSAKQVEARFARNPNDPIFRSLDSDDGVGNDYSILRRDATVTVSVPLAPNVYLADDPTARTVTLRRGIPSILDMPALDPFIMLDMREPTLEDQALGAIHGHAQSTIEPTRRQLEDVATFERKVLFTSTATRRYANGGAEPSIPQGQTASEKRGRAFFVPAGETMCGMCHFGPLLDGQLDRENRDPLFRIGNVLVSEFNRLNNPVRTYVFQTEEGEIPVESADPGIGAVTGDINLVNTFKNTSMRNIKNTAPYFHDNSAQTLQQVMDHYDEAFNMVGLGDLTEQDKTDIINFMKLL